MVFQINVPCQGSCAKRGETHMFSPMELHRKLAAGLPCPECKTEGMSADESLLLTGRLQNADSLENSFFQKWWFCAKIRDSVTVVRCGFEKKKSKLNKSLKSD